MDRDRGDGAVHDPRDALDPVVVVFVAVTATTCPQEIARIGRQARNRKREKDPALVALKKEWCVGKVCSCGCGRAANTPHHPRGALYENDLVYADPENWEPYYHTCHHNMHKGLVRCPSCGGWMRSGNEKCAKCRGWRYKNRKLIRHPCDKNLGQQRCRDGRICARSPRKAEGCDWFVARKKEVS